MVKGFVLVDYLLERIDPKGHLNTNQDAQQVLNTLNLGQRFTTFEAVLSKALVTYPWILTRWDMEIFRIAKQLRLEDVAKPNIEYLLSYSGDHAVVDLDVNSLHNVPNSPKDGQICFKVSYEKKTKHIVFFNEELDLSSTGIDVLNKDGCCKWSCVWPIPTTFRKEGLDHSTIFTSTNVLDNGFERIFCGFVNLDLSKLICDLRDGLLELPEDYVLVDLNYGVSYISSTERSLHGDGEYKVKAIGGKPSTQMKLRDLRDLRYTGGIAGGIAICHPKKISPGVFLQDEVEETRISITKFLGLRFKLTDAKNCWPPNKSVLESNLTFKKHYKAIMMNYLVDLKITLINNSELKSALDLTNYIEQMQVDSDESILKKPKQQNSYNVVDYIKQILQNGKISIWQKSKKKKILFVTLNELIRRDFSVLIDFDESLDFVIDGSSITIPFISIDMYVMVLYRQFLGIDSKLTSTINSMRLLLADINSMKIYCEMSGVPVKTINEILRLVPKSKEDLLVTEGYKRIVSQANSRRRAVLRDCSNQSRYNPVTCSISILAAIFATLALIQVLQAAYVIKPIS